MSTQTSSENRDYSSLCFYLTPSFMKEKTAYPNLDAFFSEGKLQVHSQEDFEAIPPQTIDKLVKRTTKYEDLNAMLSAALDFSFEVQLKQIKFN